MGEANFYPVLKKDLITTDQKEFCINKMETDYTRSKNQEWLYINRKNKDQDRGKGISLQKEDLPALIALLVEYDKSK